MNEWTWIDLFYLEKKYLLNPKQCMGFRWLAIQMSSQPQERSKMSSIVWRNATVLAWEGETGEMELAGDSHPFGEYLSFDIPARNTILGLSWIIYLVHLVESRYLPITPMMRIRANPSTSFISGPSLFQSSQKRIIKQGCIKSSSSHFQRRVGIFELSCQRMFIWLEATGQDCTMLGLGKASCLRSH